MLEPASLAADPCAGTPGLPKGPPRQNRPGYTGRPGISSTVRVSRSFLAISDGRDALGAPVYPFPVDVQLGPVDEYKIARGYTDHLSVTPSSTSSDSKTLRLRSNSPVQRRY